MKDLEVKDFLHEVSADNPLDPVDATTLLARGRRGRRRRRALAGSAAVAAVTAVVAAAALLPDVGAGRADSPVATPSTQQNAAQHAGFVRLPGVPRGDAALEDPGIAKATARCRLRNPTVNQRLINYDPRVGSPMGYEAARHGPSQPTCIVPGDSRPLPRTIAAAEADPVPADEAAMLRNCSVIMWHDITDWRVLASERIPGAQVSMVAMSPSNRFIASCYLQPGAYRNQWSNWTDGITTPESYGQLPVRRIAEDGSWDCPGANKGCLGWKYQGAGRVDPRIVKLRITARNGNTHEVPVRNGWFAVAWGDGDPNGQPNGRIVGLDLAGHPVE